MVAAALVSESFRGILDNNNNNIIGLESPSRNIIIIIAQVDLTDDE